MLSPSGMEVPPPPSPVAGLTRCLCDIMRDLQATSAPGEVGRHVQTVRLAHSLASQDPGEQGSQTRQYAPSLYMSER